MRQSMLDWVACSSPIWSKPGSLATQTVWKVWRQPMNPKITEQHRSRPAYIYVRQATNAQVLHHQESTERQYALRTMALELGWSESAIRTLDRDLGMTGTEMTSGRISRRWWRMSRWAKWARCLRWKSRGWRARISTGTAAGVVRAHRDAGDRRRRLLRSVGF